MKSTLAEKLRRMGFSTEAALALRTTGQYARAIDIARWGIEGFDVRSPNVYGNLIVVTLPVAELGRWDEARELAAQVHSLVAEFGELMAKHDPELDSWIAQVDEALSRAPKLGEQAL